MKNLSRFVKKNTNINPNNILFALAFSLGLGMFKVSLLLTIAAFVVFRGQYHQIFSRIKLGGWVLIALSLAFLIIYRIEYVPYRPDTFSIEPYYFEMLSILCFCALLLPFCFQDKKSYLSLIWFLCLGAFFWAMVTILFTVLLSSPPYYSRIIDLRALARGVIQYGNTPGIASLLALLPAIFFANLIYPSQRKCNWVYVASFLAAIFALVGAILIQQRSFFVIVLILQPLLSGIFALVLGRLKIGLALIATVSIYPLLLVSNKHLNFLDRKIDVDILSDARIQMFSFWLERILGNPFVRPPVGPPKLDSFPYFHNFFADIHRISGFWALVLAITVSGYIVFRLIFLTYRDKRYGYYLLSMATPFLFIMFSSVVPEGEKQPFLGLLLIGAISERLLSDISSPTFRINWQMKLY